MTAICRNCGNSGTGFGGKPCPCRRPAPGLLDRYVAAVHALRRYLRRGEGDGPEYKAVLDRAAADWAGLTDAERAEAVERLDRSRKG